MNSSTAGRAALSVLGVVLCAGAAVAQPALPEGYSFRLVARDKAGALFNIPAPPAGVTPSVQTGQAAIDEDGSVAVRYTLSEFIPAIEDTRITDRLFYYNASNDQAFVFGGNNTVTAFTAGTIDLLNGLLLVGTAVDFSFTGYAIYDTNPTDGGAPAQPALVGTFGAGGPLNVTGSFSRAFFSGPDSFIYGASLSGTNAIVLETFGGPARQQTLVAQSNAEYTLVNTPTANRSRQAIARVTFAGGGEGLIRYTVAPGGAVTESVLLDTRRDTMYNAVANQFALKDDGTAVFYARRAVDGVWELLASGAPSSFTVVAARGGFQIDPDFANGNFPNFNPDVNNEGYVALRANTTGSNTAIFLGTTSGGAVRPVAGGFFDNLANPPLDYNVLATVNAGEVVLQALGNNSTTTPVVNNPRINEAGQIAFTARLTGGGYGVFVATPEQGGPAGCNIADIVSIGGFPPPDGELTVDDYTSFINAFAGDELLADIVSIGGFPPPDGELTVDDYTSFINAFAEGCPG